MDRASLFVLVGHRKYVSLGCLSLLIQTLSLYLSHLSSPINHLSLPFSPIRRTTKLVHNLHISSFHYHTWTCTKSSKHVPAWHELCVDALNNAIERPRNCYILSSVCVYVCLWTRRLTFWQNGSHYTTHDNLCPTSTSVLKGLETIHFSHWTREFHTHHRIVGCGFECDVGLWDIRCQYASVMSYEF